MLSLPETDARESFLDEVRLDLEGSNQRSLADILSKNLMPTKHRDHFARAIDVYTLQITCYRALLESETFNQAVFEDLGIEYRLAIQDYHLELLKNNTELSEETIALLNLSTWTPPKKPMLVQQEWAILSSLNGDHNIAPAQLQFCVNLLSQESFNPLILEEANNQYQADLKKLFEAFSESFEEQIKHKDQDYDPETKSFIDIKQKDSKKLQVEKFKKKIFETELPMYQTWKPALSPLAVFKDKSEIEVLLQEASIACTSLSETVMNEVFLQTQIHQETRKKIFHQWHQQKTILERMTFSAYQEPYYNLVRQGDKGLLINRFKKDKIKPHDRMTFLTTHAPEVLHIACANNQLKMLHFLIGTIHMQQLRNEAGYYPIHYAVIGSRQGENPTCLNYLLKKGANVNARGPFACTPLHIAVIYHRLDLVRLLYEKGAHLDGLIEEGHFHLKPIHLAAVRDNMDIATFLLTHGANPFFLNQERHSPLLEATLEDNKATIMTFFKYGIWLSPLDKDLLTRHLERKKSLADNPKQISDEPSSSDKPNALEKMSEEKIASLLALPHDLIIDECDRSILIEAAANNNTLSLTNYLAGIWDLFYKDSKILMACTVQETYASKLLNADSFDPDMIKTLDHQYPIMIETIPVLGKDYQFAIPSQSHIENHKKWCLPSTPHTAQTQIDAYEEECSDTVIITLQTPSAPQAIAPVSLPSQVRESQADPYETIQQYLLTKLLEEKSFSTKAAEDINQAYRTALASLEIPTHLELPDGFDINMTFGTHLTPKWVLDFLKRGREILLSIQKNCDKLFVRATHLKLAFDLGTPESFLIQQQEKGEISQNKHPDYYKLFRLCVEQDFRGLEAWNRDWPDYLLEACPKAFHIACANNTLELAGSLLEFITHIPMLQDEHGRYPIHYAMLLTTPDREYFMQRLINRGADINAIDDAFWAPVHVACARDDLDLVKLLVTLGGSLQGVKGYDTPLHVATSHNKPAVVRYLLEQPPEKKVDVSALNQNAHTPLGAALLEGHLNIINIFIEQEHYLSVQDIHAKNDYGSTAAHIACARGDLDLLIFLVGYNAPLQEANKDGDTPLHVAASSDKPDVVRYLLAQGVDVHPLNQSGHTPLVSAILNGHIDIAKLFLEQGYWFNARDKAILVAYLEGIAEIVSHNIFMAVTFKSISRCITLEREVMRLIGCDLSPQPAQPVLTIQPTALVSAIAEQRDTTVPPAAEPTTYFGVGAALLYSAGEKIMAHVPAAPTMPVALQGTLHYLYPSKLNPVVPTNSTSTPSAAFNLPLP